MRCVLDVYGLDTKESLALGRSSLTVAGDEKVQEILDALVRVYKNLVSWSA